MCANAIPSAVHHAFVEWNRYGTARFQHIGGVQDACREDVVGAIRRGVDLPENGGARARALVPEPALFPGARAGIVPRALVELVVGNGSALAGAGAISGSVRVAEIRVYALLEGAPSRRGRRRWQLQWRAGTTCLAGEASRALWLGTVRRTVARADRAARTAWVGSRARGTLHAASLASRALWLVNVRHAGAHRGGAARSAVEYGLARDQTVAGDRYPWHKVAAGRDGHLIGHAGAIGAAAKFATHHFHAAAARHHGRAAIVGAGRINCDRFPSAATARAFNIRGGGVGRRGRNRSHHAGRALVCDCAAAIAAGARAVGARSGRGSCLNHCHLDLLRPAMAGHAADEIVLSSV
eukprot:scaffold119284_cov53-Phaeocystis_antarctica.AAC.4